MDSLPKSHPLFEPISPPLLASPASTRTTAVRFEFYAIGPGSTPPVRAPVHLLLFNLGQGPIRMTRRTEKRTANLVLGPGDFVGTPARMSAAWDWPQPVEIGIIWLEPQLFANFIRSELGVLVTRSKVGQGITVHDDDLLEIVEQMRRVLEEDQLGTPILLESLERAFMVKLVDHFGERIVGSDTPHHIDAARFDRIRLALENGLADGVSVADLARAAGMSQSHFSRSFHAELGVTPSDYIAQERMKRAQSLLRDDTISLSEIALECGFSDQSHLSRAFKKAVGITPGLYRKALISAAG